MISASPCFASIGSMAPRNCLLFSSIAQKVETAPHVLMHPADAGQRGLSPGEQVVVRFDGERLLRVQLQVSDRMAPGVVILPRHRLLPWQQGGEGAVRVSVEREP